MPAALESAPDEPLPAPRPRSHRRRLSGGVDSAVAALLLRARATTCRACSCATGTRTTAIARRPQDFQDARRSCEARHTAAPRELRREYRERVFADFLAEYRAGRTPNPDVPAIARSSSATASSTRGASARRVSPPGTMRGVSTSPARPPSCTRRATPQRTSRISCTRSSATRCRAACCRSANCPSRKSGRWRARPACRCTTSATAPASASSANGRSGSSCELTAAPRPGRSRRPRGADSASIGACRSTRWDSAAAWGSAARAGCEDQPWYVAAKDPARNALVVVQGDDHPLLFSARPRHRAGALARRTAGRASRCHGAAALPAAGPGGPRRAARGRPPAGALRAPQRAVTPGQSCVLYDGDRCLGGGVIERTFAVDDTGRSLRTRQPERRRAAI